MLDYSNYLKIGESKLKNKWWKTLLLAVMAGMFIALAGAASQMSIFAIKNASVAKMLSGVVFPIGLMMVVLLQTELFTGNSLLSILVFKRDAKISKVLLNWLIVYVGNLIGGVLIATLIHFSGILNNEVLKEFVINAAIKKSSLTFVNAFVLGILCNLLVCIAVFLASNGKTAVEKILVIFFPIMLFIIMGFEHSVANMYFLSIGLMEKSIGIGSILLNNLLPVTLGNIVGGVIFSLAIWLLNKEN